MPGRLRQDIFAVSAAKLLNGAASFLVRICIVGFLDPAAYGVLNFGMNCLLLLDALVGSALDLATMASLTSGQECVGSEIRPVEKASIRLKLITGAALLILMGFGGEWLGYRFLHGPGGRALFLVVTAGGTCILLVRSAQLYFQARMRFPLFGAIDIIHSVLRVLFVGLVLYLGIASAISILACYAVAAAAVAAIFFVYGNTVAGWRKVHPGPSDWRALLRSSGPILASTGAGSVVSRLDVFLLALRSNPVQLGLYSAALTIATIPEILGAYLAPVFQPRIFPSCKAGTFRGLFRRLHLAVYAVVGALFALVLLAGRPLLSRLLPVEYEPSIGLVLILIPGTLAVASLFPLTLSFLLMMRPRTFLIVESVAAPILVASYFWLTPAGGALAAAWITCVYRLLKAAIVQTRAYALAGDPLDRGATAPAVPAR